MQQFSCFGTGKSFYSKLQINFNSELFLKSINTHIFLKIKHLQNGNVALAVKTSKTFNGKSGIKNFASRLCKISSLCSTLIKIM